METRRAGDCHRHARARPSVGSRFGRTYVADSDYLPRMGTASGELRRRSMAGALWAFVETWGQQAIQLALFAILARLLGPEAYGVAAIAMMTLIAGDGLVLNAGWAEALVQRRELTRAHADAVFWIVMGAACALALLGSLLAGPVAVLFGEPRVAELIPWLSLSLPLQGLLVVPAALLRRDLRFAPHAVRATLAITCAGAVGVIMALSGYGVWSLVGYQLTQPMAEAVVLWRACPWRPGPRLSTAAARQMLGYTSGVMG